MSMDPGEWLAPQHRRLFKFLHPAKPAAGLLLERFKGSDGMSQAFAYELMLISDNAQLPLKSMIGQQVSIEIELADAAPRFINGYLTRFASLGSDGALNRYSATLKPWLSLLEHRIDTRIFQDCTVEEVLREVFALYPQYAASASACTARRSVTATSPNTAKATSASFTACSSRRACSITSSTARRAMCWLSATPRAWRSSCPSSRTFGFTETR